VSEPLSAYMSVEEAAQELGMAARAVRRAIEEGRLPAERLGKQYAILRRDIAAYGQVPRRGRKPTGPRQPGRAGEAEGCPNC
jgi:excisionase family DNA binding protein